MKIISAIYTDGRFAVRNGGSTFTWHPQAFGISKGGPFSPFLFVILMTVLFKDAKQSLADSGVAFSTECFVNELVYADDTLLVDIDDDAISQFMESVCVSGAQYGLSFNWSTLEVLNVNADAAIWKSEGIFIKFAAPRCTWAACSPPMEGPARNLHDE